MSRLRFSIAQIMAVVLYLGFGFAALRNASAFWASATFSVAIVLVAVALAGACLGKEPGRMSWAAFAAAGGTRLGIWLFMPEHVGGVNGIPRALLHQLQSYLSPGSSGGTAYIAYTQTCNALDVILLGLVGAVLVQFIVAKADRSVA